jgi:hypothetical protein
MTVNQMPKIRAVQRVISKAINLLSGSVDTSPAADLICDLDIREEKSSVICHGSQQAVSGRISKGEREKKKTMTPSQASPIPRQIRVKDSKG